MKPIKIKKVANSKINDLAKNTVNGQDKFLTTNQGLRINDDQNSLKSGERGAILLEDFQLREKITHFDHERIPERIVHARGSGAHGYFELSESMAKYTKAKFLQTPGTRTPVFVRFSTVAGSHGSSDLARDVRGFAVKFYTEEGNYDLVGNNIPVFFIQDAIKFPDLIHAVKPEPHNEIPQAASAHDTFWDFVKTRLIAILAADGVNEASLNNMKISLEKAGAQIKIIAPHLGNIISSGGKPVKVDQSFLIAASVLFDAVYVPDGTKSASSLKENPNAVTFINEANLHCKAIAANGAGVEFLQITEAGFGITGKNKSLNRMGVLFNCTPKEFVEAIAQHRSWDRENSPRSSHPKPEIKP